MTLELQATPNEVMRAVEALREFGQNKHIPEKTLFGLELALEECGSNIVNHALCRDPQKRFLVRIEHTGNALTIELRDGGPEFDPTKKSKAAPVTEDSRPGGWGIELIRHYIDEIKYDRQAGENVLSLFKRLSADTSSPKVSKSTKQTEP